MLEEDTLIVCLFNICCRCNCRSFLVSKGSLSVSLVDMSCKCEWFSSSVTSCSQVCCFSSVSFWCLSVCLVDISVRCDC